MHILLCVLIFGCLVDRYLGVTLMKPCSEGECPQNSSCRIRGCDGRICICNDGMMPSDDYTNCVKIVELGGQCKKGGRCRGLSTRCNSTNICECQSGYIPSSNKTVTKRAYCKQQPILGTSYSLLGEKCDGDRIQCIDIHTKCDMKTSVCICKEGYREAINSEINAYPFNIVQCVPKEFKLDVTIQPSNCFTPFQQPPLQSITETIQPTSSTMVSSKLTFLSPVSEKQTPTIVSTTLSRSLESLITETTTLLSVNVPNILSTEKTDISASALTLLQTSSPKFENILSSISTNLPTDANTISFFQTTILKPSTSEFEVSSEVTTSSSSLHASNSKTVVHLSSSFSEQWSTSPIESPTPKSIFPSSTSSLSSKQITPSLSMSTLQTSYKSSSPSEQKTSSATFSTHHTSFLPQSNVKQTTILSTPISEHSTISSITGSQITSPLPYTEFISSPSHYSTETSSKTTVTTSSKSTQKPTFSNTEISSTTSPKPSSGNTKQPETSSTTSPKSPSNNTKPESSSTTSPPKLTSSTSRPGTSSTTSVATTSSSSIPTPHTDITSIFTSTTSRMVTIQRHCLSVSQCPPNADCEMDSCGEYRCRCRLGYVENSKSAECLKLASLGDKCDKKTVCIGRFSKCSNNKCVCHEEYELTSNEKECRRQKSWFVSFPLLGDTCSDFFADCYNQQEQTCTSGTCKCYKGLREKMLDDMKVNYRSTIQCVNETLSPGYREAELCRGQIKDGSDPDKENQEEANRKIRIMKGSIIGGVMGLIVLITAIIGTICFIRYRRRTMIKDMASDHGSVVSFDRQSSGKYSFKLPRPFRLLGGEKEYESEHIHYANSMYETHEDQNGTIEKKALETQRSNTPFSRTFQLEDINFSFSEEDKNT